MSLKNFLILSSLVFIYYSCHNYSDKLVTALYYSKENRPELEKVLRHYSDIDNNKEKLQAAIFLIENMHGHFSIASSSLKHFEQSIDSIYAQRPAYVRQFFKSRYPKKIINTLRISAP